MASSSPSMTPTISDKYKDIISALPMKEIWGGEAILYQYQGFWYTSEVLRGIMSAQDCFNAQPGDIYICSLPKTGTTWLKSLAFAIVTRNHCDINTDSHPLFTKISHDLVPTMEKNFNVPHDPTLRNPEIPLIATHIPHSSLPRSLLNSGGKMVYICRDPKDVFVSFYFFSANLPKTMVGNLRSMEEVFELFCQGTLNYGPYLEHVLGYWRESLECPEKVMFVKYEDMKNEPLSILKKLAEFMGYPFTIEEEKQGVVEKIADMCSFERMSGVEVNKNGKRLGGTPFEHGNKAYFRKGRIGDWKNHLTPDMAERLDRIVEGKLSGSGLTFGINSSNK